MGANSKIEWTDHTFSPWIGCTKISPACDHCYAERSAPARVKRAAGVETWGPTGQRVRTSKAYWREPLKWNAEAQRTGTRPRVFCASLADVFDNAVPPEWRTDLFALIMRCENLDFLLLTKRVGNVTRMLQEVASMLRSEYGAQTEREPGLQARPVGRTGDRRGGSNLASGEADFRSLDTRADLLAWIEQWLAGNPPLNVWLGATVVNQEEADRDIPKLLGVPAAKRFLSIEPLLGQVDLSRAMAGVMQDFSVLGDAYIDWVIVGSESGSGARRDPNMVSWVAYLRDQCVNAGVAFFWKQDVIDGKKISAPQLDGQSWQQFPA